MVYNNPEKAASMATGVMARLANTPKIKTAISVPMTPKLDKIGAAMLPIIAVMPTVPQTPPIERQEAKKMMVDQETSWIF